MSDNAAEFIRADKEIQEVMALVSSEEVGNDLGERAIEWHFIPARSPQHNGLTEVLIKGAKNCLYKIFKGKRFTDTELTTGIKQSEAQLNARPFLAISDNKEDNNLITLAPARFLLGRPRVSLPSSLDKFSLDKIKKLSVLTRWEERKILPRRFFLRCQQDYLDPLKKRTKNYAQNQDLKRDDVVLLLNERKARLSWPIAHVEEVMMSRDNKVISCLLRLPAEIKQVSNNTYQLKLNKPSLKAAESYVHVREKRQVVAAFMAGIVSSLISTFTSPQLFGISQAEEDQEP